MCHCNSLLNQLRVGRLAYGGGQVLLPVTLGGLAGHGSVIAPMLGTELAEGDLGGAVVALDGIPVDIAAGLKRV